MFAMVLERVGHPLVPTEMPTPSPGRGEVRLKVEACGVCRTDLHVVDGELPRIMLPIIPGHEIVGRIDAVGDGVRELELGVRVGVPWLGETCGTCSYCRSDEENLCDNPSFTGYTRNGGYATHVLANANFVVPLDERAEAHVLAPLLCAGLIGWRALGKAGAAINLGIYGFGAAAHIIAQVARWQGKNVFAFTRPGDDSAQAHAIKLGAQWAGGSDETSPAKLDAAIIFAPVGALVPAALKATRKGGRVVCAGIHMSDIPSFPYSDLWNERHILSVANLTRRDAREFFELLPEIGVVTTTKKFPLVKANEALEELRRGLFQGAAVLTP